MKNLMNNYSTFGFKRWWQFGLGIMLCCLFLIPANAQISYFQVDGGWAGNDANGNAIIKWEIKVCVDAATTDVIVRVPMISGTGEGAGIADQLSDEDAPWGAGSCEAMRWRDESGVLSQSGAQLRVPNDPGANNDEVTPISGANHGLDFTAEGCALLTWVTYSKDYDSDGSDEDHYVVANVTSDHPNDQSDPGFDCTVQDSNGNQGCEARNENTPQASQPRCVNRVDCDDVATNNYEQILGLSMELHEESFSDDGTQYNTTMAYVLCHHGESDYEAGYDLVSPGNNNSVNIVPDDIVDIDVTTNEWSRTSSNGQLRLELESVRMENPGNQYLQPAATFAPFGTTVPHTNTNDDQQITNSATSFLPMDASQDNLNDIDSGSCPDNFTEICDTIFVHSTYNLVFSNPTGGEQCNNYQRIFSSAASYRPRNGYQSTGDDGGIVEGAPSERSTRGYDPDPEFGDCAATTSDDATCAAAPGEDCDGLGFSLCATPPPSCTEPTSITFNTTAATCNGAIEQNDGLITLTAQTSGTHYAISSLDAMEFDGENDVTMADPIPGSLPTNILTDAPNIGGTYIVRIFNTNSTCFTDETVVVPANICQASCMITVNSAMHSTCDPMDNSYELTVNVTYSDAPMGEDITIMTSTGVSMSFTPGGTSGTEDFVLAGFDSDGTTGIDVTATFSVTASCTDTANDAYDAPMNCAPSCDVTIMAYDLSSCDNATNTFHANLDLEWDNAPTTGGFEYRLNNGTWQELVGGRTNMGSSGMETVTVPDLMCSSTKTIDIRFADATDCFEGLIFVFPPTDPAGFLYCVETGEIIPGGEITVTPPMGGNVVIQADGSSGYYSWIITGQPAVAGEYVMGYTPPAGYSATGTPGVGFGDGDDVLDPNSPGDNPAGDDPLNVGAMANVDSTFLVDFSTANNPFFFKFALEVGDPFVELNNLPLTGCTPTTCDLTLTSVSAACQNGETGKYDLTIEVSYTNGPGGVLTANLGGGITANSSATTAGDGMATFMVTNVFNTGETDLPLSVFFADDPACNANTTYDAPANCCPDPFEICEADGESYTLTAEAGLSNYQWQLDGMNIAGAMADTYTATMAGTYTWTAEDGNGCPIVSCCETVLTPFCPVTCMLTIAAVTPMCTYDAMTGQSSFSVEVELDWDYDELPTTPDMIEVTLDGQTETTAMINTTTPGATTTVTFANVSGPAYDLVVNANFVNTTSCATSASVDLIACTDPCTTGIGGTVFQDFNNDGTDDANEPGQENIKVEVYDCDGQLVCDTWTNANGEWTCPSLTDNTEEYRVEFSTPLQDYLQPSYTGADNGTDVQFVNGNTGCVVDYGTLNTNEFCTEAAQILIPCYVNGNPLASGTAAGLESLVRVPYTATGTNADPNQPDPEILITAKHTGAIWGNAYQRDERRSFFSAVVRRHAGLGTGGLGGVYVLDEAATTTGVPNGDPADQILFVDLEESPYNFNFGTLGDNVARGLPADMTATSLDTDAFDAVGKEGIGDIEVDETDDNLWVVNLADRNLIKLDISGNTPGAAQAFDLTNMTGWPSCPDGEARPWGLDFYEGRGYVTVTCTGENNGDRDELEAYLFSFDPNNPVSLQLELLVPLDYLKGQSGNGVSNTAAKANISRRWNTWVSTYDASEWATNGVPVSRPMPIFSDVVFDGYGGATLGFIDRAVMMTGTQNVKPDPAQTGLISGISGGEILRACTVNGVLTLENSGACGPDNGNTSNNQGPGGGEFYFDDDYSTTTPNHLETAQGGLFQVYGAQEVVTIAMNPHDFGGAGLYWFQNFDPNAGSTNDRYEVYDGGIGAGIFGKSAGLGDIEGSCDPPPIQIGNYVWEDTDEDGVQDPCEEPVQGVPVSLYNKDTDMFEDVQTTGVNGEYYFNDVAENTNYAVVFGYDHTSTATDGLWDETTSEFTIGGATFGLTTVDADGTNPLGPDANDRNDSDASPMDMAGLTQYPIISYMTSDTTDHTLDVGLIPLCEEPTDISIIAVPGMCTDLVPNNDGHIILAGVTMANRYGVSTAGAMMYDGPDYDTATDIPVGQTDVQTDISNAGASYILRLFNMNDGCFKDTTVVVPPANCPVDPQGFIYCEDTGEIIMDGTISVSGPGNTFVALNGESGEYQFYTDGTVGVYTITYTPPAGYVLSTTQLPAMGAGVGGALDPTENSPDNTPPENPLVIGSGTTDGMVLDDFTAATNPYYLEIEFMMDDPEVFNNNIPLEGCALSLGSTVFLDGEDDATLNNADMGIADVELELYRVVGAKDGDGNTESDDVLVDAGSDGDPTTATDNMRHATDASGNYHFTNLISGEYYLKVPTDQFATGEPLEFSSRSSSDIATSAIDNGVDNDDNGIQMGGDGGMVMTPVIELRVGQEPFDADTETGQANTQDNTAERNGDMTVDMGFVCSVTAEAGAGLTICSTSSVDLTALGASITPASLGGTWSSSTGGTFVGGTAFSTATAYQPSPADILAGQVILTLTTDDPAGDCPAVSDEVLIIILKVDCGTFPWDGNQDVRNKGQEVGRS